MRLTKIYCGRSKPDGSLVRLLDIAAFLKAEVATQYEGYTIVYTTGCWNGVQEESFIIEIITDPCKYPTDFRPKQIANVYKTKFKQESVLITTQEIESIII